MLERTEIERLAQMAHALRPDWPVKSVHTWLAASYTDRAYRDVAVALAWVATDAKTVTPKRMDEMGPWWVATRAASNDATDTRFTRCKQPGHGSFPAANCSACRSEQIAGEGTRTDPRHTDPEHLAIYERGARRARAAIKVPTNGEVR